MSEEYKLSSVLYGHTQDVRSVISTPNGYIVSTSRDRTAKIWQPYGTGEGYCEVTTLAGHKNFVACVCYLPPDSHHLSGLILTGSNDNLIFGYCMDNYQHKYTLEGHSAAVCGLSKGLSNGTVVSSSWDNTARIWNITDSIYIKITLSGHQAAVWSAIQLMSGNFITASADKTIRIWNSDGDFINALTGHTDCVRHVAASGVNTFLSCGNDATIRHWDASSSQCIAVFYGHSHFIYCISLFPENEFNDCKTFVSCGEDQTVRVWKDGVCEQTIMLPSPSIWCVTCLPNGDIAVGSSDSLIRVFSRDPGRRGSEMLLNQFNEEVANANAAKQENVGGIKLSDLEGEEALLVPGNKEGQTKIIREDGKAVCYSWSCLAAKWEKVGDVVGATGGDKQSQNKTVFEGKEYDYVFSVDIDDTKPPLKLPYNRGEDPWTVAQKFIQDNELSQLYLDQVVDFIMKNSSAPVKESTDRQYSDPFTGSNRYIPGGSTNHNGGSMTDPFTGGSKYSPNNQQIQESNSDVLSSNIYFPQTSYLKFDQANLKLIQEKLVLFNKKTGDGVHNIEESRLEDVMKLADLNATVDEVSIQVLKLLLEWPQDIVFPALDITRLALRNPQVNTALCKGETGDHLVSFLRRFLRPQSLPTNQLMTLRIFCNMMCNTHGELLVLNHKNYLLSTLMDIPQPSNKHMQIAIMTLLLNFAVAFERIKDSDGINQGMAVLIKILPTLTDPEAQFRGLVTLGTLIFNVNNPDQRQMLIRSITSSPEVQSMLDTLSAMNMKSDEKRIQCAIQVSALLQI